MKLQTGILIVGTGIIGMALARSLLTSRPPSALFIDKEEDTAHHAAAAAPPSSPGVSAPSWYRSA